jgi:hypothetical protein
MRRSDAAHRLFFGAPHELAGTVYGTVVAMATVTAGAKGNLGAWELATLVASTALVLWIAHVYADGLGESVARGRRLDGPELGSIARRELAIVLAAVLPAAALVLGALDVLRDETAVWIALAAGLVTLVVEGVRYARLERLGAGGTAAVVGINLALGLAVVGLKAALTH